MFEDLGGRTRVAPYTGTIAGHRCRRSASIAVLDFVYFRIKLPRGGLDELAASLSQFPDVLQATCFHRISEPRTYRITGDGFVGELTVEGRARYSATLFVEMTGPRPPRRGLETELWDSLVHDPGLGVERPRAEAPAEPLPRRPPALAASVSLGRIRLEPVAAAILLVIEDGEYAGCVLLSRSQAAELQTIIAPMAIRSTRYSAALEERRTKPEHLWQQAASAITLAQAEARRRLGALIVSQRGPGVLLQIADGKALVEVAIGGSEARQLCQHLVALAPPSGG